MEQLEKFQAEQQERFKAQKVAQEKSNEEFMDIDDDDLDLL